MSHSNFSPKIYQEDIEFKVISSSLQPDKQNQHLMQSIANQNPMNLMNESDFFNDNIEAEGIDPSINESIRESIHCSFVSSECNQSPDKRQKGEIQEAQEKLKDFFVMNRMNWITYLKALFDQLESFNQNRQKHVENVNFVKGLKKIKNLLPLLSKNDYYKTTSEVAFTYKDVETGINRMPKYISWDNLIDIFLAKQFQTSVVNNPQELKEQQQFQQVDKCPSPEYIDDSICDDMKYERGDVEPMKRKKKENKIIKNKLQNQEFFLSFADSVIKMTPLQPLSSDQKQQFVKTPILQSNLSVNNDKDEDDACEIDSDSSEENEEEKSQNQSQTHNKIQLEESIRSSRTATFKSIRQANQITMDSYYTLKNGLRDLGKQPPTFAYQQQQLNQSRTFETSKDNQEDDQVEVGSSHNQSLCSNRNKVVEVLYQYEDQQHQEKSTRLSSQNSLQKVQVQNHTMMSQTSRESSQSQYQKKQSNVSKASSGFQQNQLLNSSNTVDIDLQGKGLKNFEIDFKQAYGDKRQLRAINLSHNSLVKLNTNLERSLQFMNVGYNKLKSLHGIEQCLNLKFLNVQGNMITSVQGLSLMQNLKELIFANNQLSIIKELGSLRNLELLDLSYNKLIDYDKVQPLQNLKKLSVLSLSGNILSKSNNYQTIINKMFPYLKELDPVRIIDHSQFLNIEKFCFSDLDENHPIRVKIETDAKKERSKTPNRDRSASKLETNNNQKLKSSLGSPTRLTKDNLDTLNTSAKSAKSKREPLKRQSKDYVSTNPYQTLQQYSDVQMQFSAHKDSVTSGSATKRILAKIVEREEEKRSKSRTASRSNISRNKLLPVQGRFSSIPVSQQQFKDLGVKKIQVNVNFNNTISIGNRITPIRSNITTPRGDVSKLSYNKTLICQTEENSEMNETLQERDKLQKQSIPQDLRQKKSSFKKEMEINIFSPVSKIAKNTTMIVSSQNRANNSSNLRSKLPPQLQKEQTQKENKNNISQSFITRPMTTRSQAQQSQQYYSFVQDNGRQTPQNRPPSQLQKFISASKDTKQTQKQSQQNQNITNLLPRAYLSRIEQPGEKKQKADMSSSRIIQNIQNSNYSKLQEDDDSGSGEGSKSLSPVCEESSNIRKYKVDLSQLMKQK